MSVPSSHGPAAPAPLSEDLAGAPTIEEIENEGRTRPIGGWIGTLINGLAISLSLYALYWVVAIVQPQIYRVSFLLLALVLSFLHFPAVQRSGRGVNLLDWTLIGLTVG